MFKLEILYKDKTVETITVKRVSNIAATSDFFYYEKPNDERGKGTCIKKDKIECWEVSPL